MVQWWGVLFVKGMHFSSIQKHYIILHNKYLVIAEQIF